MRVLLIGMLALVASCGDPIMILPGGALTGTTTTAPADWSSVAGVKTIQVEFRPKDPYSHNIWGVGIGPDLYIATDTTRYQAHDLDNVTDVEAWTWPHTGRIANVYHHNFVHHGHARITIEDANGKIVYDHIPVEYDLVNETQDGEPGDWRVMIELFGAKGRVDFSVAKKR